MPNTSEKPGSDRFFGIRNPALLARLQAWSPDAVLLIGYNYASMIRLIFTPEKRRGFPLFFRGDSHRLGAGDESRKSKVESRSFGTSEAEKGSSEIGVSARTGDSASPFQLSTSYWRRRAISAVYARFAAFLYVGHANREYFRLHRVPDKKLFFAPHAIDNERFASDAASVVEKGRGWRKELGIPETDLLILFAGKVEEKKRPLDLVDAFKCLRRPDVSLLFVGNGKLEGQLRRAASDSPKVFFAPFQNQSEMPRTYGACDLFVLPSYGPEESWGLAVNEALCLARAVIVSSHVGCAADLVRDGENGLVFEAGNVDALAAALNDALSDRDRLQRWGTAGRRLIDSYDYAHATAGLLNALEHIAAKTRSAAV